MNINAERFLRMTALLAAASAAACTSNTTNNNNQPVTGTGGSNSELDGGGGATGKAGAAGKAGSGGGGASSVNEAGTDTGVPDSGNGDSGGGGGAGGSAPTCLGDIAPAVPDAGAHDAGAESLGPCPDVPTASIWCQPDSGAEGFAPAASLFCSGGQQFPFRAGVFGAIEKCLAALPVSEACTSKHTADAIACYDQAAAKACSQIPTTDGGDPCTTIHKNCDAVSLDDCHHALNAFSGESGAPPDITSCVVPTADAGACAGAFWACVLPYGVTR